jgi:hypothetical protein
MKEELEELKGAIAQDEYYEFEISEGVVFVTDVEFDGTFSPYIVDTTDSYNDEEIDVMMENFGLSEVFLWDMLEYDENNDVFHIIVTRCEYEEIDLTVWE